MTDNTYSSKAKRFTENEKVTTRESSTVRNRCLLFIETLHKLGYERIPIDQAKQLFRLTVNVFDRASIKAYFGTYQHVSTHSIQREARYQSGNYSFKTILLKQKVPYQPGYLDLLGLVTYEWVNKTLFLIPKVGVLVPILMKASDESIADFSLSLSEEERAREAEESNVLVGQSTNNNNIGGEREIGRVKVKVIPHTTVQLSRPEHDERIRIGIQKVKVNEAEVGGRVKVKHSTSISEHIPKLTSLDKFVLAGIIVKRNDDKLERALGHKP
jgi:hypothetical protein